jgi:hypothetical protein
MSRMTHPEPSERMIQLQAESLAVRNMLNGRLSDVTRPAIEELLSLIHSEIEREREVMTRSAAGAQ